MADPDLDAVLDAVGPRLRTLRTARNRTLAEVSAETGISESTLSRLEGGGRRPNLELLLPLARTYGVALDELVGAPQTGDPRVHLRPVRRHNRTFVPLTRRPGGLQAYKMICAPGPEEPAELQVHEGYEWCYVLEGVLRLCLGDRDLELAPGEAAEFDTHVPHWMGSAGPRAAEVLVLFGAQGERAHLRTRA
jgi:transcriptional regulator with XRE-family HTH domain